MTVGRMTVGRTRTARSRRRAAVLSAALLGAVPSGCGDDRSQPRTEAVTVDEAATLDYVIPVGAGKALDAGTPLEILPAELEVNVGDTIRIENQDDRGHTVGPFFVGANETLTQRFSTAGEFEGVCTVHPSGQLVLVVNA
jgi:plastocyanin